MKANCKKCKHCMQIHGREVMCRRFLAVGTKIDGFIRIPTYCVYYKKRSKKYNGWSLQ